MRNITLPSKVNTIIRTLNEAGFEAYAVGGCVRDSLIGRIPGDWDITTSGRPAEVKALFRRTVDTGIEHGTVTVLLGSEGFEVTTYRLDGNYSDGRHPDKVDFTASLEEDLKRRDFTINAMAYHPDRGIVDLFGGMEDLKNRVIRAVGDPMARFEEDALRILRAVRFSAQLGFDIDPLTFAALRHFAPRLARISRERIRVELTKLLVSPHPETFRRLYDSGITAVIFPRFDEMMATPQNSPFHCMNVGEHTLKVLSAVPPEPVLRLAALLHDTGKVPCHIVAEGGRDRFPGHAGESAAFAESFLRELTFDNKTVKETVTLIRFHDARYAPTAENVRRALNRVGRELFPSYLLLLQADNGAKSDLARSEFEQRFAALKAEYQGILDRGDCCFLKELAVSGRDLIAAGAAPGPALGELLEQVLDAVLKDPSLNKKEVLLALFPVKS